MDTLEKVTPVAYCPMLLRQEDMAEDSISVADIMRSLWRGKWAILAASVLAGALAAYVAFMVLPKTYRAEATLQPSAQSESGSVGKLLGNLPLPLGLSGGGESTKVTGMLNFLKSKSLAERLIVKYDLLPVLYEKFWNEEKRAWDVEGEDRPTVIKAVQSGALGKVFETKYAKDTSLVTLTWVAKDPAFAAEMLNRVVEELKNYLDNEYVSDAKREREFVERQLQETTRELEFWEASIPTPKLTQSRISRELIAAQTVFAELRRQLALAQIGEAKDVIRFKTLDQPFIPELKHGPKRLLIIAGSVMGAGFLVSLLILMRSVARADGRAKQDMDLERSNESVA